MAHLFSVPLLTAQLGVYLSVSTSWVMCFDCKEAFVTCARFQLGHKTVNQYGFAVMLTLEEACLGPVHPNLDLRCVC